MDKPPRDVVVILRRARSDLDIAEHALSLGDEALPDAAVHLQRALYAHACLCAIDQDLPLPGFREFSAGNGGQLNPAGQAQNPVGGQKPPRALLALGEQDPWLPPSTAVDLRQEIRGQVKLLEDLLGQRHLGPAEAQDRPGEGARFPRSAGSRSVVKLVEAHRILVYALAVVLATALSVLPFFLTYQLVLTTKLIPFSSDAKLATLENPKPRGARWNSRGCIPLNSPLSIPLSRNWRPVKLDVSLDNNDRYEITFYYMGRRRGSLVLGPTFKKKNGLELYVSRLPRTLRGELIDVIVVRPVSGDGNYSIGHLLLAEKD